MDRIALFVDPGDAPGLLNSGDWIFDARPGIESSARSHRPRIGCLRLSKTFAKVSV